MDKKILIISPAASHPQNAGQKARIYSLARGIKDLGCEVHFLYCDMVSKEDNVQIKSDIDSMKKNWDKLFHLVLYPGFLSNKLHSLQRVFARGLRSNKSLYVLTKRIASKHNGQKVKISTNYLDNAYPDKLDRYLLSLLKKEFYDFVFVEYAFLSRALKLFPTHTIKVLDTHDAFSGLSKENRQPGVPDISPSEEKKALQRADIVLAIQSGDKEYFESLLDNNDTKVMVLGHKVDLIQSEGKLKPALLFVGTSIDKNLEGINYFIDKVLPLLRKEIPELSFVVAGNIGNKINSPEIQNLGEIENIQDAYDLASIVIAPVFHGTGLKIKVIEALGRGKPVICTAHAIRGLESLTKIKNSPLVVAKTPEDFVSQIKKILTDKNYSLRSNSAYEFAKSYNQKIKETLQEILSTKNEK